MKIRRASGKEESLRLSVDELIFFGLKLTFCETDIFVKGNYQSLRLYIQLSSRSAYHHFFFSIPAKAMHSLLSQSDQHSLPVKIGQLHLNALRIK